MSVMPQLLDQYPALHGWHRRDGTAAALAHTVNRGPRTASHDRGYASSHAFLPSSLLSRSSVYV